jgi:rubrerythrin/uncharacterized damage-inducible protein DinB
MRNEGAAWPGTDRTLHFVRIARSLEGDGLYNAAKVLRALAFSEEVRATNAAGIPVGREARDRLLAEVLAATEREDLRSLLESGRRAALEDRIIPLREIPEIFVCRTCGEIALRQPPRRCPGCGAHALTFREIVPIYFLEPLPPIAAERALQEVAEEVRQAVEGLSDEAMARSPSAGEWGIRDVLFHLLEAEGLLAGRVERILVEDEPSLEGVASWAIEGGDKLSGGQILRRYRESREATARRLASIRPQDWLRTAVHSEWGLVTLLQQASYFAKHDASHIPQIAEIRRAIRA